MTNPKEKEREKKRMHNKDFLLSWVSAKYWCHHLLLALSVWGPAAASDGNTQKEKNSKVGSPLQTWYFLINLFSNLVDWNAYILIPFFTNPINLVTLQVLNSWVLPYTQTSSQKLRRCASRRVRSVWKSLGQVRFWSKMFGLKILAYLHSCILSY